MAIQAIQLSLFSHQINALCGEMGARLSHAAISPNIRDRLDYSCAMFDCHGQLCAQAAHIPVHLGSMAFAMKAVVEMFSWAPGDLVIFNDPYMGGTHLPDVTIVLPVFVNTEHIGFVVNRAHHADIGADEPGSMPLSTCLQEEGIVLSPQYLGRNNSIDETIFQRIFANVQSKETTFADISAQVGANLHGASRLTTLVESMGVVAYKSLLTELFIYSKNIAVEQLSRVPDGVYTATDFMDDDGAGNYNLPISVSISIHQGSVNVDFSGSTSQVNGNINCPKAVTAAAVFYVFRCLMNEDVPTNSGSFSSISMTTEEGSLVDALYPAAVAAGNVETSSRIVDVLFSALAKACPQEIAASSQGTMNNIAMGSNVQPAWSYYETIGGGAGANAKHTGMSAVQTHMTNTQNTPIEVLEMNYPLQIQRYEIRNDSAGLGQNNGGDGIVREFKFLASANVTILSERRLRPPLGLYDGGNGAMGVNYLNDRKIAGKINLTVKANDRVRIETPGGGGYGSIDSKECS